MKEANSIENTVEFYWQLFKSLKYVLLIILIASVLQLLLTEFNLSFSKELFLFLIIVKSGGIVVLAFNQLTKIIGQSHLLSHILVLFGLLIVWLYFLSQLILRRFICWMITVSKSMFIPVNHSFLCFLIIYT